MRLILGGLTDGTSADVGCNKFTHLWPPIGPLNEFKGLVSSGASEEGSIMMAFDNLLSEVFILWDVDETIESNKAVVIIPTGWFRRRRECLCSVKCLNNLAIE